MSMPSDAATTATNALPAGVDSTQEGDLLGLFTTLARTGLFLEALQRESLGGHGLTFREYSVLRLLQRAPDRRLPPSLLAEKIVCTTGAMTKLVDRLQRGGHVARAPDPGDRRGVLVEITDSGGQLADRAAETYRVGRARVLERLDEDAAARIHGSLEQLLGALEADRDLR